MTVDVVILAYTLDSSIFEMNSAAIESLRSGEPDLDLQIIVVESNPGWQAFRNGNKDLVKLPGRSKEAISSGQGYGPGVKVLVPEEKFNFNRFNNLGMACGSADWILFSNNDVLFHPGCISAMLAEYQKNPEIVSFCPVDPNSPYTPPGTFKPDKKIVPGYLVRVHFTGWCFLTRRSVFEITGPFDTRFDYYFADDDFCMVLRQHNLINAVIPHAQVSHLANITSKKLSFSISDKFKIDQQKFRDKWGSQRLIAWKNRLSKYLLQPLGMHGIIHKLYRPKSLLMHWKSATAAEQEL